jgi:hypothetical protein
VFECLIVYTTTLYRIKLLRYHVTQRKPSKPTESGTPYNGGGSSSHQPQGIDYAESMRSMTTMVSNLIKQRPELLDQVGERLQVEPEVLATTLKRMEQGDVDTMPPDVLEKMSLMQQSIHPMMMPSQTREYEDEMTDLFEEEKNQSVLQLYRGSFLSYADLAFGPVMLSILGVLFYLDLLPLIVAIFLVPAICFALSMLVHGKILGLPTSLLPASRMAGSMVLSLEVMALIVFTHSFLERIETDLWPWAMLMYALGISACIAHVWTAMSDPGYIPQGPRPPPIPFEQLMAIQKANPYNCVTCGIYKPIRSKHCSVCNRCVPEFDHHCPVVMNCVGVGNRRIFSLYIFILLGAEVLWWVLSVEAMKRLLIASAPSPAWPDASIHPSLFSVMWHLSSISKIEIEDNVMTDSTRAGSGAIIMFLAVIPILLGTAFQVLRQIFCILAGLTPNELIVRAKYDYLKDKQLLFYNPFDLGPLDNCLKYWSYSRPDWYSMYSERTDLDPDTATPRASFSNVLRVWDKSKKALDAARERKDREREERLLAAYGGSMETHPDHSCPHC